MSAPAVPVAVVRMRRGAEPLPLPRYMTSGASGMDLLADVDGDVVLAVGERRLVPTGLSVAIPPGFEGQVRPRSGLAVRNGVTVLNAPGTIKMPVAKVNPATVNRACIGFRSMLRTAIRNVWERNSPMPVRSTSAGR